MKAKEAFQLIAQGLAEHYPDLGFKYYKTVNSLTKRTKKYTYGISFWSFAGNRKNAISLGISFGVGYNYTTSEGEKEGEGLLGFNLRNLGIYYTVSEENLQDIIQDLIQHLDRLLIPFIDIFENHAADHLEQWTRIGFTGHLEGGHFPEADFDYTTHKHYWLNTDFFEKYNEFGFEISLLYLQEEFGREAAQTALLNYLASINPEARHYFIEYYRMEREYNEGLIDHVPIWPYEYEDYPDIPLAEFAAKMKYDVE